MAATCQAVDGRMAGAASPEAEALAAQEWYSLNFQRLSENVRRLQVGIVKATQKGRHGKATALQRLLTSSFSGKALAVKRVTENLNKGSPGGHRVLRRALKNA